MIVARCAAGGARRQTRSEPTKSFPRTGLRQRVGRQEYAQLTRTLTSSGQPEEPPQEDHGQPGSDGISSDGLLCRNPSNATDDPINGDQLARFLQGYYKEYCYLPLHVLCGEHLLCAYTSRGHILRFCTTALRGRRAPPSQSDGLGGPSYKFPQFMTGCSRASFGRSRRRSRQGRKAGRLAQAYPQPAACRATLLTHGHRSI